MLIDTSYFYGDLEIAQLTQPAVLAKVNRMINSYESKYLRELLGYQLYRDFQMGLLSNPIDQKWTDLLYGAEYTNRFGQSDKWGGILRLLDGGVTPGIIANPMAVIVGRGQTYDPAIDATTVTIPTDFVGTNFVFMQRGFGPLREDEYSVTGNVLTLLGGLKFSVNDTYFYFGHGDFIVDAGIGDKQSPIANYVYYWYLRHNATTTAGGGEASNNVSAPVSPAGKQTRAWNEMVQWNREMIEFLYANNLVYGFDYSLFYWYNNHWMFRSPAMRNQHNLLEPINTLGF